MKKEDSVLYILLGRDVSSLDQIYFDLFQLYRDRILEDNFAVITVGNLHSDAKDFNQRILRAIAEKQPTEREERRFLKKIHRFDQNLDSGEHFIQFSLFVQLLEEDYSLSGNRMFIFENMINTASPLLNALQTFELFSSEGFNRLIFKNDNTKGLITYLNDFESDESATTSEPKITNLASQKNPEHATPSIEIVVL